MDDADETEMLATDSSSEPPGGEGYTSTALPSLCVAERGDSDDAPSVFLRMQFRANVTRQTRLASHIHETRLFPPDVSRALAASLGIPLATIACCYPLAVHDHRVRPGAAAVAPRPTARTSVALSESAPSIYLGDGGGLLFEQCHRPALLTLCPPAPLPPAIRRRVRYSSGFKLIVFARGLQRLAGWGYR